MEGVLAELADGQRRAAHRQRRDDGVHARAVGQAGVDHRRGLVDAAADAADDLVDDAQQVLVVGELRVRGRDLAAALDEDRVVVVDHHLGDGVVAQEGLQRAVAEDVVRDLTGDLGALLPRQRRLVERERLRHRLAHALGELVVVARRVEQARPDARDDVVVDPGLELAERIGGARGGGRGTREVALGLLVESRWSSGRADCRRDWSDMDYAAFRSFTDCRLPPCRRPRPRCDRAGARGGPRCGRARRAGSAMSRQRLRDAAARRREGHRARRG